MMYFYSDLTPPIVRRLLRRLGRGLVLAAVMLLSLGIIQAHAQVWGPAYNPNTYRNAVVPLPFFQIIHNAPDLGPVDVYIDNHRFWNDAAYLTAAPFTPLLRGSHKIDFVAGADADNSHPIWTETVSFRLRNNYALIAMGTRADSTFDVLVLDDLRLEARSPDRVEYALVHSAPDAPALDLRLLDPLNSNRPFALLANNFAFGSFRSYGTLDPIGYNFQITNADNSVVFDVLRFELQAMEGETLIFLVIPGFGGKPVTLMGVDVYGHPFFPSIVTATDDAAEAPETLALRGNYPNPFNPSTTISFDLPETAQIHVEIIDLLGRSVLTMPVRRIEAGAARTLTVDASTLASGTYLYRVVAQTPTHTLTRTGRMVLAK